MKYEQTVAGELKLSNS